VTALLAAALLPLAGDPVERVETASDAMAAQVFGTWVWPFELLSLLLLVALVAALAVARMTSGTQQPDASSTREAG
jgi:NADH:ubiquinone oxidoreductase subunit 6 (subunit J)